VENYFVPITSEKMNAFQNKVDPSIFEIPPLGRHYSELWQEEDVELDAAENQQQKYLDVTLNLIVAAESLETHGLTQRLLSLFIDEKKKRDYTQEDPSSDHNANVAINTNDYSPYSLRTFEEKVLKELKNLGVLGNIEAELADDEICKEIKNLQEQLRQTIKKNEEVREEILTKVRWNLSEEKNIQRRWQEVKQIEKEYKTWRRKRQKSSN